MQDDNVWTGGNPIDWVDIMFIQDDSLSANWIFSLWCVPLKKSRSLNWPWSTNILGQFITCMHKFIGQSDVKHIMTSLINNNVSSEGLDRYYHKYPSSSHRTRWDISDNVCLDLQNCRCSVFIFSTIFSFIGGGDWSAPTTPPTCCNSLTNFLT